MTWAKFDDGFDEHPRYLAYSADLMGLIACAITYSNRRLTDGIIPSSWPAMRFGRASTLLVRRLITDGIWSVRDDGNYEIVGFLDHNSSKEEVRQKREILSQKRAEAGRIGGLKSGESKQSKREANDILLSKPSPLLASPKEKQIPVHPAEAPDAPHPPEKAKAAAKKKLASRIDPDWQPDPKSVAFCESIGICREVALRSLPEFVDYWSGVPGAKGVKADWPATFRNHIRRLLSMGKITPGEVIPITDENTFEGLPIIRAPGREKAIPKPGQFPDLSGLFGKYP